MADVTASPSAPVDHLSQPGINGVAAVESHGDVGSTIDTAAKLGVAGVGINMLVNAADGKSSDVNAADAQSAAPVTFSAAPQNTAPTVLRPEPQSAMFKQWRGLVDGMHAALGLASKHLPEADRAQWEAAVNAQLTFVNGSANFTHPETIETAFLPQPGKSSQQLATERYETIALALGGLTTPASAVKFFETVKQDWRWSDLQEGSEFSPADWMSAVALNKTGETLAATVNTAIQHADANIALDSMPNSAALKAAVHTLATAVQSATGKVSGTEGNSLSGIPIDRETDGKTPEQRALERISSEIITGLKLTEATPVATAEQLAAAAAFVSQLSPVDVAKFIHACHAKDAKDG